MRALLVAAVLLLFPLEAAAWSNGFEPGAKSEQTQASASNALIRRVWAIDDGSVVSRVDTTFATGGGAWTNHGHGGSPTVSHGLSATSYVDGSGNMIEHVFYFGQDGNLYMGTITNGGAIAWTVIAKPAGTFMGHIAATSFLSSGTRYLVVAGATGTGTLWRWVRTASGGVGTWTSNTGLTWIGQHAITITKNPAETIVSIITDHHPSGNPANRSLGMVRWNGGWTVTNVGKPSGALCSQHAAIQGVFATFTPGYRFTIACIVGTPGSTSIFFASTTSESSTTFTWTSGTLPAPVVVGQSLAGAVRGGTFAGSFVHEFFLLSDWETLVRVGVTSSSTTITNVGPVLDVEGLGGGLAIAPRAVASRLFYNGVISDGVRMFERRGVTSSNLPGDYRWMGSVNTAQFWLAPAQAAESKVAAWRGTEALGVINRPGTGGPTDFPSTHLVWTDHQNEYGDPSTSQQVTKVVNISGVGNVTHNYVVDPTTVVTQFKRAYQVQLGLEQAQCTSSSTITRSTIYMVSTTDGVTHTAPVVVETKANSSTQTALDHPWADIEHKPFDIDTGGGDIIHIAWWDVSTGQIRYRNFSDIAGTFGPIRTLRTGSAGPPRITAADNGRVIVYYGVPNGELEICELDAARVACTTPPGSTGGWTPIGAYYYLHNVPVAAGGSIRSWYPVSAAMSESDPNTLHYCVEVRENDGTFEGDVKCGRVTRDGAGSWTVATSVVVNAVADDDKDQFLPEVAVTSEDDGYGAQDTVLVTWYDRANDPANDTFEVMKSISTDGGTTFAPPRVALNVVSDGQFLPRHCRNTSVRFLGDYAAAEGDLLHKNMPAVVVTPSAGIHTWVFSLTMGLGSWGE